MLYNGGVITEDQLPPCKIKGHKETHVFRAAGRNLLNDVQPSDCLFSSEEGYANEVNCYESGENLMRTFLYFMNGGSHGWSYKFEIEFLKCKIFIFIPGWPRFGL